MKVDFSDQDIDLFVEMADLVLRDHGVAYAEKVTALILKLRTAAEQEKLENSKKMTKKRKAETVESDDTRAADA